MSLKNLLEHPRGSYSIRGVAKPPGLGKDREQAASGSSGAEGHPKTHTVTSTKPTRVSRRITKLERTRRGGRLGYVMEPAFTLSLPASKILVITMVVIIMARIY